jgi:hypothetical protein
VGGNTADGCERGAEEDGFQKICSTIKMGKMK